MITQHMVTLLAVLRQVGFGVLPQYVVYGLIPCTGYACCHWQPHWGCFACAEFNTSDISGYTFTIVTSFSDFFLCAAAAAAVYLCMYEMPMHVKTVLSHITYYKNMP
jgi:hypothetical protein